MYLLLALLGLPLLTGAVFFVFDNLKVKYVFSIIVAAIHLAAACLVFSGSNVPDFEQWLRFDALTKLFLLILSNVYFWVMINSYQYLFFSPVAKPEKSRKIFYNMTNLYLFANTLALISNHLGLYWVALESTTLCVAPLIYYYRDKESLEAMWKYLFLVSVGIAFAFIGILFLTLSMRGTDAFEKGLYISNLIANSTKFNMIWLKASYIFIFVGLSTKIGIAPMHPGEVDAVSNSPSPIAALISASLGGTALMGVLRMLQITSKTPIYQFSQIMLIVGGISSLIVTVVFMFRLNNYKRMIAYSSVEHLGIVVLGLGIGGIGLIGAMFHLIYNSLTKMALFFMAGNIHRNYKSREIPHVFSLLRDLRWTGILFLLAFLAVVAMPPFGIFFSELMIFQGLLANGQYVLLSAVLFFLLFIFIAMSRNVFKMMYGSVKNNESEKDQTQKLLDEKLNITHLSTAVILCVLIAMGLFIPPALYNTVSEIAKSFNF
ncbi:MAG: proton-conducting transporter membrane subunit [Clostridiales bacterium]